VIYQLKDLPGIDYREKIVAKVSKTAVQFLGKKQTLLATFMNLS